MEMVDEYFLSRPINITEFARNYYDNAYIVYFFNKIFLSYWNFVLEELLRVILIVRTFVSKKERNR